MEKIRIYKFDTLKVICMLLVVMIHTLSNSNGCLQQEMIRFILTSFTMPLFLFVSGYFSKPKPQLLKNIHYLLLPFLVFTIINDGIQYLVNPDYVFSWKKPGFAMWYLFNLFIYRISLKYLIQIPYILTISFLLSWGVGFFPQIGTDFSLSRIFCYLPFFLLGYMTANNEKFAKVKNFLLNNSSNTGVKICLLLIIYIVWEIFIYQYPGYTYASGFYKGYGFSLTGLSLRIALQITKIATTAIVISLCPNTDNSIAKYGERTVNVYLLHGAIVLPFAFLIFPPLCEATVLQAILMILVPTSICCLFFSKPIDQIIKYVFKF